MHGEPREGLTCKATWEDITTLTYCEYRTQPSGKWLPAEFSSDTIDHLLSTQFGKYLSDVEKAAKDCAAAVRRLVTKGPPVYLADANALPLPEGDTHIDMIWYSRDNTEHSAQLKGALTGDERQALWDSQKATLEAMEQAENVD
uniref:Uncharacterized protein n=1 Tax=Mucochytrium quahogii TaxID=96639 RepID=A0A7S2SMM4_9STRA|mmetsp:Transcript_7663/g.12410  ORF Transcript_7663/g.12410 Transcript_7663/m.12410 type:complete len:144 (+) Transcript_7663:175-606(+)